MIKFPYGNADFKRIVSEGQFFVDRTGMIPLLEETGNALLFLRPRRFGKSLWLSVLENYYDLPRAERFEILFGGLDIGRDPTPLHNRFLIMKWNFSTIAVSDDEDRLRRNVYNHINDRIWEFALVYRDLLPAEVRIDPEDALSTLNRLLAVVRATPHRIYLLIDEYDNFANEVLTSRLSGGRERYERLVKGEGLLKTLFKAVKDGTKGRGIDRAFIVGVSPVVMSDMTSGFNIAENIYLSPQFEDLCGFREPEIAAILEKVAAERGMGPERVGEAMKMMRAYYDGYRFSSGSRGVLYNPTLVLYFLKRFQSEGVYPEEMLDDNLAIDRAKLDYIAGLPDGETLIWKTFDDSRPLTVQSLAYRFGIREMFHSPKDFRFMLSFLYYFGVLTWAGERDEYGEHLLRIPNLTIRSLYAERIRETLLPEPGEIDEAANVARQLYQKGQMGPL